MASNPICPICGEEYACWCTVHKKWECYNCEGFAVDNEEQVHRDEMLIESEL